MITTGASFGAYHAMAFGLRHPDLVDRIIGLSGLYDIRRFTGGYSDENVYRPIPPTSSRTSTTRAARRDPAQDIILAIGRDDPLCDEQRDFSTLLWKKGSATRCASGTAGRTTGRTGSR